MPEKPDVQINFRESLKDVIAICNKLSPHCTSFEDLIGILNLAMENDAQLKIIMAIVTTNVKAR